MIDLANQIPFIMAPAAIIAATMLFSIIALLFRALSPATQALVFCVILGLSGYGLIMLAV